MKNVSKLVIQPRFKTVGQTRKITVVLAVDTIHLSLLFKLRPSCVLQGNEEGRRDAANLAPGSRLGASCCSCCIPCCICIIASTTRGFDIADLNSGLFICVTISGSLVRNCKTRLSSQVNTQAQIPGYTSSNKTLSCHS